MSLPLQLALVLAVFAGAAGLALVAGIDGLGRAATVGQLAFAAALMIVLLRLSPGRG